jgi:hypothetical protein
MARAQGVRPSVSAVMFDRCGANAVRRQVREETGLLDLRDFIR